MTAHIRPFAKRIDSAPRNGRKIILISTIADGPHAGQVEWLCEGWWSPKYGWVGDLQIEPTHWMEIPDLEAAA
jgi:hypothetical protein